MPIIRIEMLRGRSADQKARLAEAITRAMTEIAQARPEDTNIVFQEIETTDWAVGGRLLSHS